MKLYAFLLIFSLILFGCVQNQKYVCSDSSIVDNPSACPSAQPSIKLVEIYRYVCPDGTIVASANLCPTKKEMQISNPLPTVTPEPTPNTGKYLQKTVLYEVPSITDGQAFSLDDIFSTATCVIAPMFAGGKKPIITAMCHEIDENALASGENYVDAKRNETLDQISELAVGEEISLVKVRFSNARISIKLNSVTTSSAGRPIANLTVYAIPQ
ncbi:MAG: hypothetical protein AABX01_00140 [Candidatus Micrarchaeota archaeon]